MYKHKYKAAAVIAGLSIMASSMSVSASGGDYNVQKLNTGNKNVSAWAVTGGSWKDCLQILIPGVGFPGFPDWNGSGGTGGNQPDSSLPEVNEPETNLPEENLPQQPDTNLPGTPDNNIPDSNFPGGGTPDNNQPETNVPDQKPEPENPGDSNGEQNSEVSESAMKVVELVNAERAKQGLPALKYDASIGRAAQVRAQEIEVSFSHTRPDGSSFTTAMKEQGVTYRGAGENIAWGQKSPEQVMNAWMNSSGHRANILGEKYTRIGVGYYVNEKGVKHWVQLFAY